LISVPSFVVIGGAEIGAAAVRQLLRARQAGRLKTERIVVVDRDPHCRAAAFSPPVHVEAAEWAAWLDEHLEGLEPDAHLVPYHWAPHLFRDWMTSSLRTRGLDVSPGDGLRPRGLPYEGATSTGDRALSYATWLCPPTCIEPALCPHTRGARDWSLAADLARPAAGEDLHGAIVFRCLHLVYGVGTVPIRDLIAARDLVLRAPGRYLVATSSHCHGLAAAIEARRPFLQR
jgi:hypothetical protein